MENKKKLRTNRDWKRSNPDKVRKYTERYKEKYPWVWSLNGARQRCNNPNHPRYHRYGGRGIMMLLTKDEVKKLWIRDNAENMVSPSLDRKDNDEHYKYSNCQFIERSLNSEKDSRKTPVICIETGEEYASIHAASVDKKVRLTGIWGCTNGHQETCGGFHWKYKKKEKNNVEH